MTAIKKKADKTARSAPKAKQKYCVHSGCKSLSSTQGYCRLHYLANHKHIKFNKQVKAERRLNSYVDKLAKKYPDSYMEKLKEGLASEDKFLESVEEFDIEPKEVVKETDDEFLEKFLRIVKPGQ